MKFGVDVPVFGPYGDARVLADLAAAAEAAGWDGFFIWDQITGYTAEKVADVQVALAAIALATQRIRFGALITPLARRRPVKYAREAAALDRLSNGRLICGVGLGNSTEEFEDLGEPADLKQRAAMLDEALVIVNGLWTGKTFSFHGTHFTIRNATFQPPPVQQPRIPIWVAGTWPLKAPFRRAARWDGVFPLWKEQRFDNMMPAEEFPKLIEYVRSQRADDTPFEVAHWGISPGSPARAAAIAQAYARAGVTWWLENISPWPYGGIGTDDSWPVEAMRARIVQGPPKL